MLFNPISGDLVPSSAASSLISPIETMQESNTETFEIGWTGIVEDRVKITADLYYSKQNNFVSPLLLQTPLVTLNGQDIGRYITVPVVTALTQAFIAGGLDPATAAAQAQAQAATVIPQLAAGLAQVPLGVVSSPEFSPGSDLIVSYQSVGDLTLFGSDFAMQWFLTDQWTLGGTYSWVSKERFPVLGSDPISLNAPRQKGTVSLAYRDVVAGFNSSFSAVSAGFAGDVPAANVVDVGLGYQVPSTRATLQLAVQNVFDSENFAFVGVPSIGRYGMVKVKYDLF
jgi:iron complex outermembrane receptor protein